MEGHIERFHRPEPEFISRTTEYHSRYDCVIDNADVPVCGKQTLTLVVKNQRDDEVYFKMNNTSSMDTLMKAYCDMTNVNELKTRFLFDGQRLQPGHTPAALNMTDWDEIDAMEQQGGYMPDVRREP